MMSCKLTLDQLKGLLPLNLLLAFKKFEKIQGHSLVTTKNFDWDGRHERETLQIQAHFKTL